MNFTGRTALVTGGASGIGFTVARQLAAAWIMLKRDRLITQLEERMSQKSQKEPLFTVRRKVV
jgi:NAD(P)-dependent dehydrogenase (short-subunit alcohol dehydrogenase family)